MGEVLNSSEIQLPQVQNGDDRNYLGVAGGFQETLHMQSIVWSKDTADVICYHGGYQS